MTAIVKIVLLIVLAVGALSLAGCRNHKFRHDSPRHSRINVVDYDQCDSRGVDVQVYRSRSIDRHEDNRRGRR